MPAKSQLNIAVCDDESTDRARIISLAGKILYNANIPYRMVEYESAKTLFAAIQEGIQFQLLILDVMMDEMGGMELAALLREQRNNAAIIFISNNREMAMRGYEVAASRYLAKPVEPEKLEEAVLYCCRSRQEKKEILIPIGQGQHKALLSDIQFVEAYDRGTRFVLADEILDTRLKFSEAEAMLPKQCFIHCHRAYIANIAYIKRIRHYEFEMKSGVTVPISKHRYSEINKKFMDYITD